MAVNDAVTVVGQRKVALSAAAIANGTPFPKEVTFDIYVDGVLTESTGMGADGKSSPQDHLMDGHQKLDVHDIDFRMKQIVGPTPMAGGYVLNPGSGHGKLTVMKATSTMSNFWINPDLHPGVVGAKPSISMGGKIERVTDNSDKAAPDMLVRFKVNGVLATNQRHHQT